MGLTIYLLYLSVVIRGQGWYDIACVIGEMAEFA